MSILPFLLYISMYGNVSAEQRKAFVNPQSDCRIQCLNGGFCAYLVDNPSVHTCLCLLNVYHGDRCQYAVTETTQSTSAENTVKPSQSQHSGSVQRPETERHPSTLPVQTGKLFGDENVSSGIYQVKESRRITNTEVTKVLEENDYTEGWDTPTDNDDNDNDEQYAYDYDDDNDQRNDGADESSTWLDGSDDDYRVVIGGGGGGGKNSQRIYLNKKKNGDDLATHQNNNKRLVIIDKETLARWKGSSDKLDNDDDDEAVLKSELESESDDGWMISKRRPIISRNAGSVVITNRSLIQLLFLPIIFLINLLR